MVYVYHMYYIHVAVKYTGKERNDQCKFPLHRNQHREITVPLSYQSAQINERKLLNTYVIVIYRLTYQTCTDDTFENILHSLLLHRKGTTYLINYST